MKWLPAPVLGSAWGWAAPRGRGFTQGPHWGTQTQCSPLLHLPPTHSLHPSFLRWLVLSSVGYNLPSLMFFFSFPHSTIVLLPGAPSPALWLSHGLFLRPFSLGVGILPFLFFFSLSVFLKLRYNIRADGSRAPELAAKVAALQSLIFSGDKKKNNPSRRKGVQIKRFF